jgi:hypothetical protein
MRRTITYRGSGNRQRPDLQAMPVDNEGGPTMSLPRRCETLVVFLIIAASVTFVLAAGVVGQNWRAERCETQTCLN